MVKQNYAAINKWKQDKTERIQILPRKEEHLSERIQQAIDQGLSKSRQSYIIEAVKQRLAADGIPEPVPEETE